MNRDGNAQTRLTNDPGADLYPAWSPDGSQIAFQGTTSGQADIYKITVAGGSRTQLTDSPAADFIPDWQRTPAAEPPDCPQEPNPDLSDNFGSPGSGNPSGVGDPVNVATGNVYDLREDLNLPGKGLPLQFVRTYNSQDTIRKPLGYGWTHSYNASLKRLV